MKCLEEEWFGMLDPNVKINSGIARCRYEV